jgi:hypothetical protein
MKKYQSLIAVVLLVALSLSLCACGISREEAIGAWSGTYVYNGNTFSVAFVLSADGNYAKTSYKNGDFNKAETGTWEIDGGKVVLHENGNTGHSVVYKYQGDALVNNDHKFYKAD